MGDLTKEIEATPRAPMEIEVVEIALVIAPLTLPIVTVEEMQPIDLPVLSLPAKPAIIEVANEEGPDMASLPVIQATIEVLPPPPSY